MERFIQNPGKETVSGQYSPKESEALSSFAGTGNPKCLIPLEEKLRTSAVVFGKSGDHPDNPLAVMVLDRLIAEADVQKRGVLGRAYLKSGTLMKKSCEIKGEKLLFGAANQLDWSEFSEQGREDYENGNYGRAARCLALSVDKLLKKERNVLDSKAAKKWLAGECRLLADIYLEGKGTVTASPERALSYLETAAEQAQDPEAAYRLGTLYSEGRQVPANPERAGRYMTMAANQGHVRAGTDLAYAMLTGQAWAKELYSESRVLACLNAGLKERDAKAIFYMGLLCCIQGRLEDAVTWFEKIPEWNAAGMTLGELYFKQGDYRKAVPFLKQGCDVLGCKYSWEYTINSHVSQESQKFIRLSECMGLCYASGLGGCEKDPEKARVYLEDAVAYQGAQARTYDALISIYMMDGDSKPDQAERILRYWLKAQELGSSQIPVNFGMKMALLLKDKGAGRAEKELVSRCVQRLNQLTGEGDVWAKYESCVYYINLPYAQCDNGEGVHWEYSDRSYLQGFPSWHVRKASEMERLLDEAFAGGVRFASYIKGKHYLKSNKTGKAYECFQKGAEAGDLRAQRELSHFKKTLLGYSYQK